MTTVDDQALVRVGLRKILETEPEMAVVGEAGDGENAVACARRLHPDVVLMDIRMPVLDGIEATRRIARAQPTTRVLILTTFGRDTYVYDALRAGASGFMVKDAPPEEIAAAAKIVANGDALLAPAVTRAVIEAFTSPIFKTRSPRLASAIRRFAWSWPVGRRIVTLGPRRGRERGARFGWRGHRRRWGVWSR
jgi:DNA-binding NarL/FixJ family response regulator